MQTILHIGAGQATELNQWLETGADRILLVEPNPELAESLRKQTAQQPQITVVEVAITPNPANNQLREYNLPEASSLRPATGLKTLFPGLKLLNTHTVATLTPAQLLEQYGPEAGQPALLVLQAPGEEQAIVQALIESNELSRFTHLALTANPEALYEGSAPAQTLLQTLQDYGYDITEENQQDPDWPTWQLQRNPLKDQINELQAKLNAAEQAREKAEQGCQSLQNQLDKLQTQSRDEIAQLKQRAEKQQAEAAEQRKVMEKQLEEQQAKLKATEQARKKAEEGGQSLQTQLDKQQAQSRDEIAQLKQQAEKQQADATEQRKMVEKQLEEQQAKLHAAEQAREKAEQGRQSLQNQLDKLQTQSRDEIAQLKQQAEKQQADATEQRKMVEKQLEEQQAELKAIQYDLQNHKGWLSSRKKQVQEQEQTIQAAEADKQQLQQEKMQLQASQSQSQEAFANLQARMEQLFSQQTSQFQQAANALGQHVTRSFGNQRQHFQTITGLNQYLESGEPPLEFGGWAIGADLATHLVRAIENTPYDLIIEFGSGTSTELLAKTVYRAQAAESRALQERHLPHDGAEATHKRERQPRVRPDEYDLPRRILSFEQDKHWFGETQKKLRLTNLANYVDLSLAPLVPTNRTHQSGKTPPLFYDCEQKIAQVAQLYTDQTARILILVDGPTSPQGDPLAREPALSLVLQYLSAHQLDLVLDDANREGEQQVVQEWRSVCEARGLPYQEEKLATEKGALRMRVNP